MVDIILVALYKDQLPIAFPAPLLSHITRSLSMRDHDRREGKENERNLPFDFPFRIMTDGAVPIQKCSSYSE